MKKKYKILWDNKWVEMNVAPENEQAFLEKYKNLLLSKGCVKCKKTKKDGKRVNAWANIQVYKGKKEDLANAGYQLIDENDEDDEE